MKTQEKKALAKGSTPHIWTIVEHFYCSRKIYLAEHDSYERQVNEYVERLKISRDKIRLGPEDLSRLLHFKVLATVRDEHLEPLKAASHALFRHDSTRDFFDRLINDIFHEISILKEEHYNVLTYSPNANVDKDELGTILDEVHEMFPIKVHRLKHLYELALARVEKILPRYRENVILIRSLFLQRDGFVAEAYPDGLIDFYRLLYGEKDIATGFRVVGDSFYKSGFYEQALVCFAEGDAFLKGLSPSQKRQLAASWKEEQGHFKRYRGLCESRLARLKEDE